MLKVKRKKKCRVCRDWYRPRNTLQAVCGKLQCAIEHGKTQDEKLRRRTLWDGREQLKSLGKLQAEAQTVFNAFIRLRDDGLPCISCDETDPPARFGGAWDCGHFLTVGAHPELRFVEANAHRQCKSCNGGSGRFSRKSLTVSQDYRNRLILRIGLPAVESLEGPHQPKKYRHDDLRAIKSEYQKKRRELKQCRR